MQDRAAEVIDLEAANARLMQRREELRRASGSEKNSLSEVIGRTMGKLESGQIRCQPERSQVDPGARRFWRRARDIGNEMAKAGVMAEFLDATLADYPPEVERLLGSERGQHGVRIAGPVGAGKSRLAAALVRMAILSGRSARFVLAGDLFSEIRETFRDDSKRSEREVVDELCGYNLLVIDDLAREGGFRQRQSSEYVLATLHRILSKRNGELKQTVVTSNLTLDEIEQQYDESISSRMSIYQAIVLDGPDRRHQARLSETKPRQLAGGKV